MNRPNMTASKKPAANAKPRALNKAQAGAWQPDELDAPLQAHLPLDEAAVAADSSDGAMMLASAGQASSLGEVSSTDAATVADVDAGAATISPAAIGAGIFGVAAVIAASGGGGGGSGGSAPSTRQDSLQTNPNKPGASTKPPATDKPGTSDNAASQNHEPQAGGREPGNGTNDNTNNNTNGTTPGSKAPGVAQATGPADKPNVAESGNTQLKAETFALTLPDGSAADFIRISNIRTSHGTLADSVRMVRYGDDDARPSDAQGLFSRITLKAPGEAAAVNTTQTGYEVYVHAPGPVTLAEARALATRLGGKLLVIDDQKEADWLQQAFKHQLQDHKAWIESHALETANVAQRTGPAPEQLTLTYSTETAADARLPAFIIEYANYQHPLMLKKDGKLVPVTEGDIIARADLDKLVWNADNNTHATLVIEAVDSADPATAQPIKDGEHPVSRVIELREDASITPVPATEDGHKPSEHPQGGHPHGGNGQNAGDTTPPTSNPPGGSNDNPATPLPSYDSTAQHVAKVAHDSETAAIDPSIFHGKTPTNAPESILISNIQVSGAATKPVLSYVDPNGEKHAIPNDTKGYNLLRALYEKLSWDSVAENSGSFSFMPADSHGNALPDAVKQTVSVTELPASTTPDNGSGDDAPADNVPHYENTRTVEAPHDAPAVTIGEALFKGDNPKAPARFIEILSIQLPGDAADDPDKNAPPGSLKKDGSPLSVGDKVADAYFGKITWDASQGQGGRFSFKPVADLEGTPIEGAESQVIRIFEHPAAPTYERQDTLTPTHDQADFKIPAERILGTQNPSKWVKIISINGNGDAQADTPLMLEGSSVKAGALLTDEQVAKLSWDASKAENGSIVFRAMADANGTRAVQGTEDQTLRISELPSAPPTYDNDDAVPATYNQTRVEIPADRVLGTGTPAKYVKIIEISTGQGNGDETPEALKLGSTSVKLNQILSADEVRTLTWDASKAVSGSFKFVSVLDDQGTTYSDAPEKTITFAEAEYKPTDGAQTVANNSVTPIDTSHFGGSVDGSLVPAFIKITAITSKEDELKTSKDRVVREHDNSKTAYQVVKVAEGLTLEEAEQKATAMGGKILDIKNQEELDWLKSGDGILSQLNFSKDTVGSDVTKGAWFKPTGSENTLNPKGENMEGLIAGGDANNEFQFVDLQANQGTHTKLNAFVVEFENYNAEKPGLVRFDSESRTSTPVVVGEKSAVFEMHNLGNVKIAWDSLFNHGGSIRFIEVIDSDGQNDEDGAKEKTINITETTAAAPEATGTMPPATTVSASALKSLLSDEIITG